MRKLALLLLALILCLSCAHAEEEEEISMEEILSGAAPEAVQSTITGLETEEDTSAPAAESIYESDGSVLITISAVGDFTVGGDSRKSTSIFDDELKRQGGDIHFTMRNTRDIFLADDLTIVNFEGTLTDSTYIPANKKENQFLFSAPPSYAGVVYSTSTEIGVMEIKGVQVAMLSYLCIDRYAQLWDVVPRDIAAAKEQYPIVIVSFHWGNETYYQPTDNQVKMGRLAVDAGADLVLGHHSHRIQPIECYKGVYICYSLGNFCFAGNSKPSDMSSFIFQTRFRLRDGQVSNDGFRIIPIRISSRTDRNDFIPTVLEKDTAIDSVLSTLKENGRKLQYAVEEYPLEWK